MANIVRNIAELLHNMHSGDANRGLPESVDFQQNTQLEQPASQWSSLYLIVLIAWMYRQIQNAGINSDAFTKIDWFCLPSSNFKKGLLDIM